MAVRQTVRDFLEREHVPYATVPHKPAFTAEKEAATAEVPARDWAKTVVCFADDQAILAVLPASLIINFEKLRALTRATRIRLATEAELAELYPDCEVGATPALGPLYKQRVFVDERLSRESEVVFNAGTHTDAIRMTYAAFAAVAHPVVGEFGELPKKEPTTPGGPGLWT
jgi:Ala-tRNA(Pro) deacylase